MRDADDVQSVFVARQGSGDGGERVSRDERRSLVGQARDAGGVRVEWEDREVGFECGQNIQVEIR